MQAFHKLDNDSTAVCATYQDKDLTKGLCGLGKTNGFTFVKEVTAIVDKTFQSIDSRSDASSTSSTSTSAMQIDAPTSKTQRDDSQATEEDGEGNHSQPMEEDEEEDESYKRLSPTKSELLKVFSDEDEIEEHLLRVLACPGEYSWSRNVKFASIPSGLMIRELTFDLFSSPLLSF